MSNIDEKIDAAVVSQKARADDLNDRSMDEYAAMPWKDAAEELIGRAIHNLHVAEDCIFEDDYNDPDIIAENVFCLVRDLCDAANLCALALSVLPNGADR